MSDAGPLGPLVFMLYTALNMTRSELDAHEVGGWDKAVPIIQRMIYQYNCLNHGTRWLQYNSIQVFFFHRLFQKNLNQNLRINE